MKENEPQVIASAQYRGMDGRVLLEIVKAGRRYKFVSKGAGEPREIPFKTEDDLKDILSTWEVVDTPDRQYERASEKLLTDFWAATNLVPDPLDILLEESKLKNPFL